MKGIYAMSMIATHN